MEYYVVQVLTGTEDKYLSLARPQLKDRRVRLLWPRRKLTIRKRGVKKPSLAPIFPGYLFVETAELSGELYWLLRNTHGFVRFLDNNQNVKPLEGRDRELLTHFLSFGEIVERSRVTFDENSRIRVVEGPMEGLEGRIVKVDKRKGRAKVKLDLYGSSFLVDFGFEHIGQAPKAG